MARVVYKPVVAMYSAAYCSFVWSCTVNKIINPTRESAIELIQNPKRCWYRSESDAIVMLNIKAHIHGGMDRSRVCAVSKPRP